jgi:hypothetical protein
MKVQNVVTGKVFEPDWRRDVSASSYGQPVLCLIHPGGRLEAVDWWQFAIADEDDLKAEEKDD